MANTPAQAKHPASKQDATSSATSPVRPKAFVRFDNVRAAIFAETVKTAAGKEIVVHNVTLRVAYRDKNGELKHTHVLKQADLLPAAEALRKCYQHIEDRREDY